MLKPDEFLQIVREQPAQPDERRLGAIDPAYVSGRPKVTFDGESTLSVRTYSHLASYTPAAEDRVALIRFGHTWLIIGKIV